MNAGKAAAYYHAIEWLSEARAAYRALDRHSEWSAYRTKLMDSWAQVQVDGDAEAAGFELIGSFRRPEI